MPRKLIGNRRAEGEPDVYHNPVPDRDPDGADLETGNLMFPDGVDPDEFWRAVHGIDPKPDAQPKKHKRSLL